MSLVVASLVPALAMFLCSVSGALVQELYQHHSNTAMLCVFPAAAVQMEQHYIQYMTTLQCAPDNAHLGG